MRCPDRYQGYGLDLQCEKEADHQNRHENGLTGWPGPLFATRVGYVSARKRYEAMRKASAIGKMKSDAPEDQDAQPARNQQVGGQS